MWRRTGLENSTVSSYAQQNIKMEWTVHPSFLGTIFLVLKLKALHPGKPLSTGQTETVGHSRLENDNNSSLESSYN